MCTTRSWQHPLATGIISVLLGILFVTEPALTLRIALYSLGILALAAGVLFITGAVFFSRGSGPLMPLLLAMGIFALVVALLAFLQPDLLGGVLAIIAAAVLIIGGLIMAATGLFQGVTAVRKALMVLGGFVLVILGLLFVFHAGMTATLILQMLGLFLLAAGMVLVAAAVVLYWQEQKHEPEYIDAEIVQK